MKNLFNSYLCNIIIIFSLFIILYFTSIYHILPMPIVSAQEITGLIFEWDANTEPDLKGYKLYSSNISSIYDPNNFIDITDPNAITYTLNNIPYNSINYFVLTAYDLGGNESDFSNEVYYDIPPLSPSNFKIIIHIHTQ